MKTFITIVAILTGLFVTPVIAQELGPIQRIAAPQFQACKTVDQAVNQVVAFEAGNGRAHLVEGCEQYRASMQMLAMGGIPLTVEPIALLVYETRTWEITKVTVLVDGAEFYSWAVVKDEDDQAEVPEGDPA